MEKKSRGKPPIENSKKTQARINREVLKKSQTINPDLGESEMIRKAVSEYANKEDKQYKAIIVSDFHEFNLFGETDSNPIIFCHHEYYEQYRAQYPIKCSKIIELPNGNFKIQIYKDSIKEIESYINSRLESINSYINIYSFNGFIKSSFKFNPLLETTLVKSAEKINGCQKDLENKKSYSHTSWSNSFNESKYLEKIDTLDVLKWIKKVETEKKQKLAEGIKIRMNDLERRKVSYLKSLKRDQASLANINNALNQGIETHNSSKFIGTFNERIEESEKHIKEVEDKIKTLEDKQYDTTTALKQTFKPQLLHLIPQDLEYIEEIEINLKKKEVSRLDQSSKNSFLNHIQMKEKIISDIKKERNLQDVFAYLSEELNHYENKKQEYFNKIKNKAVDTLNSIAETIYNFTINEDADTLDLDEEKKKLEQFNPSTTIENLYGKRISIFDFSDSYLMNLFVQYNESISLEGVYYSYSNTSLDNKKDLVEKALSVSYDFKDYNNLIYKIEFLDKVRNHIQKNYKLTRYFSLSNIGFFKKPKDEHELKVQEKKKNELTTLKVNLQKSIQNFIDEYKNLPNIEVQIKPKSYLAIEFDEA